MAHHQVKSWPMLFQPALEGRKTHDIRDGRERTYSVGDTLELQEFDPATGRYTGRSAEFKITYITSNGTPCALSSAVLQPGYVVLSIELTDYARAVARPAP